MSADTTYLMGYGSWAILRLRSGDDEPNVPNDFRNLNDLNGISSSGYGDIKNDDGFFVVPLLSANYSKSNSVQSASTFDTPLDLSTRNIYRLSSGVNSYSGSISFELTYNLSNLFFTDKMMQRRNFLDMIVCDGEARLNIIGAVWSSFSISANANQIVDCSISFSTCNEYNEDIEVKDRFKPPEIFNDLPELAPYWQYGADGVESFQLSFSRSVNPVYLNEHSWKGPSYLRVGMLDVNFQITCWEKWFEHLSLVLGPKKIVFDSNAFMSSKDYAFSGMSGNGVKTYTVNALGRKGNGRIFSFQNTQIFNEND